MCKATKHVLIWVEVFVLLVSLFGCARSSGLRGTNAELRLTERIAQEIMSSIESEDAAALRATFSDEAKINAFDFDKGIDYTFGLFEGKVVSISKSGTILKEHIEKSNDIKEISGKYKILTDENVEYLLYYQYYYVYESNPKMIGVYKIKLTNLTTLTTSIKDTMFGANQSYAGVYSPSWDEG